jgi:hypothetical protein
VELAHRHRDLPGAGHTADIAAIGTELTLVAAGTTLSPAHDTPALPYGAR